MEHRVEETSPANSVKTFVLFDTETTGLPSPGYNPGIVELCFIAVTREELLTKQKTLRVVNKLVICVNPCKKIGSSASEITGLYNDALEDMVSFNKQAPLITMFLKNLPQPVCLIAHNGNEFDFPLLVSHLRWEGGEVLEGLLCTDSLEALRTFDGLPPVPEYVLQKRERKNLSAASSTVNTRSVKSVKEMNEVSGKMFELNRFRSIRCQDETVIKTHQSSEDNSDSLKRTAEELETPNVNSKHARVSPTHNAVWDKVEQTPHMFRSTKSHEPELTKGSEEDSLKRSSHVKKYLFKEDCGTGIENKSLDPHPVLGENIKPSKKLNGTAETGSSAGINSGSVNLNASSLTKIQDNTESLEATGKFSGDKLTNRSVVTQNYCSLENNSVSPVTSAGLVVRGGKTFHSIQSAEKLSYSLLNVYARMFGKKPAALHSSEGDCLALLEILNSKMAEFSFWCDNYAVPLASISPMY